MYSPFSLPVIGASLLAAVGFGVHLGESSIGLINPIYFAPPPLHPRDRGAAIEERMQAPPRPVYAQLYGWEQGYAARAADCGDCDALGARAAHAYSARVPYFGSGGELGDAVAEARADLGEGVAEVPEAQSPRHGPVERYAHYPVSADEPEYFEFKEPPNGAVTTASVE